MAICVETRKCLLGAIEDSDRSLSIYGTIAANFWEYLINHYLNIELDGFVVMSNHIHGIIKIVGSTRRLAPTNTTNKTIRNRIINTNENHKN